MHIKEEHSKELCSNIRRQEKFIERRTLSTNVGRNEKVSKTKLLDTEMNIGSGASQHVVSDIRAFKSIRNVNEITIEVSDGGNLYTNQVGTVLIRLHDEIMLLLSDVFYS